MYILSPPSVPLPPLSLLSPSLFLSLSLSLHLGHLRRQDIWKWCVVEAPASAFHFNKLESSQWITWYTIDGSVRLLDEVGGLLFEWCRYICVWSETFLLLFDFSFIICFVLSFEVTRVLNFNQKVLYDKR